MGTKVCNHPRLKRADDGMYVECPDCNRRSYSQGDYENVYMSPTNQPQIDMGALAYTKDDDESVKAQQGPKQGTYQCLVMAQGIWELAKYHGGLIK